MSMRTQIVRSLSDSLGQSSGQPTSKPLSPPKRPLVLPPSTRQAVRGLCLAFTPSSPLNAETYVFEALRERGSARSEFCYAPGPPWKTNNTSRPPQSPSPAPDVVNWHLADPPDYSSLPTPEHVDSWADEMDEEEDMEQMLADGASRFFSETEQDNSFANYLGWSLQPSHDTIASSAPEPAQDLDVDIDTLLLNAASAAEAQEQWEPSASTFSNVPIQQQSATPSPFAAWLESTPADVLASAFGLPELASHPGTVPISSTPSCGTPIAVA
eukprot:NODE_1179_length_1437_cov_88.008397_g1168_i0.p1 GENE.NODE_1179_length_1437_cov_88.008397_g1168_i0~~NODE_1179_length_1437_cov_88.008397_g1168_i0.p1  ORF type:complete len:270 (-),score=29.87 NODE_1179_length_1437_cov_88.008397_g1168_i0:497-1306(-)